MCAVQAQTGAAGAGVPKSGPVLVMGVVPYLSARKLAELYEPLRQHLALSLGQPVVLESAPTYADFLARSATGRYDLLGNPEYSDGEVLIESVYRFKGRSAPCVILTEVDFAQLDERVARKLFVGATRATMKLILVMSQRAAEAVDGAREKPGL